MTVWRECRAEEVTSFLRSLGTAECFQSDTNQVDDREWMTVFFFGLSVNEFQGVCGHARAYDRMCEFRHKNTDTRASTVVQTEHS